MALRSGNGFTGTVDEYLYEVGEDRVIGWVAIYARESGAIMRFSSKVGVDPSALAVENLQCYLVFYRRYSKVFTIWIDGYNQYALIGKGEVVSGVMLSDERFLVVQGVMRTEWEARPQ